MVQETWLWDHGKVPIQDFFVSIHKTRGSEWSNHANKRASRESLCFNMQIRKYLEVNKLIYDHQSGFLLQHSAVIQLCYLTHEWTMALDQRQCVQAAFLDLSKACNQVHTAGLLFKLSRCGFSPHFLKWMKSFLANRRQRVQVGSMHSEWATLSCGIPQGVVLGPTLSLCSLMICQLILWGSRLFLQMTLPCFPVEATNLRQPSFK